MIKPLAAPLARTAIWPFAPILLLAFTPISLGAQPSAPQAAALASQSLSALIRGIDVTDTTMQGTANYAAGSDEESGPVTLQALGHLESLVALNLSGGRRQEIQNGNQAAWTGLDGRQHPEALHNSLNPAAWFSPALFVAGLVQDPNYSLSYVGLENLNGVSAQHVRAVRALPGNADPATRNLLLQLATSDLYVDAGTLLPVALEFNIHPDNNALQNLPVRIEFSDYRRVGGVQTPYHVQKFLQGSLLVDVAVTRAAINSGLPPSDFEIQ
jgi:hypothetical protein